MNQHCIKLERLALMFAKLKPTLLRAQSGITLVEYAILFGLVIVMSIVGLKLLGGNIASLLDGSGTKVASNNPISVLNPAVQVQTPSGKGLVGSGYYQMAIDPKTGQPVLAVVNGANATATNVSSIDGNMNTLGGVMLAKSLDALAAKQTDPVLKSYYAKMAWNAYYLAGTEGELDNLGALDINPPGPPGASYTKGDALHDIFNYSQALSDLMNNPPANLNTADFLQAMPLATDAFNISKQYENSFSRFADAQGNVANNFGVASLCNGSSCPVGTGVPGSALADANLAFSNVPGGALMLNKPYDQIMDYSTLKATSNEILDSNNLNNTPVVSTITDARGLNTIATSSVAPAPRTTATP
jgi:Flp pilus assembly pilin Flp